MSGPKNQKSKIDVVAETPQELLHYNPLLGNDVISVDEELDTKVAMINEVESLALINKQMLAAKRQKVELEVDNKKLDVANKTVDTIDKIIEAVSSETVIAKVAENIETAQDLKYMAEAAERLTGTLRNLMNPNVADELGARKHIKIRAMFGNKAAGDVFGGSIEVEVPTGGD